MIAQPFVWACSPLEKPKAEIGCIVATSMEDAREQLRKLLDPKGSDKWSVDELNADTVCGKLKRGKARYFWIITDPVELGTLGDPPGQAARAFIVYAESSDSRRGPWISRAQNVVAAVSAFLSDQDLNLASGDPVDELPISATELSLPLSRATWNIGNRGKDETGAVLHVKEIAFPRTSSSFGWQTWQTWQA